MTRVQQRHQRFRRPDGGIVLVLPDRRDDFAGEVRALLANRSAEGIFWDWPEF